jgi:PhzF family phenazine biosynthesis protein
MALAYSIVDAFTQRRFTGNGAAVVIFPTTDSQWPSDAVLQSLAAEINLSETVFLVRRPLNLDLASASASSLSQAADGKERADGRAEEEYDIRWFTPKVEVDLCGHATLAAAHVLFSAAETTEAGLGRVVFHSKSGLLSATLTPEKAITLDFPAEVVTEGGVESEPQLLSALRLQAEKQAAGAGQQQTMVPEVVFVGQNRLDMLVAVSGGKAAVEGLQPDFTALGALQTRCVIVTSAALPGDSDGLAQPAAVFSRVFAPACGIDEDPVTGSAHCGIGPFWAERLGVEELWARQCSPRGGDLHLRMDKAAGRVHLTGHAVTVMRGTLLESL